MISRVKVENYRIVILKSLDDVSFKDQIYEDFYHLTAADEISLQEKLGCYSDVNLCELEDSNW